MSMPDIDLRCLRPASHFAARLSKVMAVLLISETLPIAWIQVNFQAPSHMQWWQVCINPSAFKPVNPCVEVGQTLKGKL